MGFPNPVESFIHSKIASAKKKIEAIDVDKDGVADVVEIEAAAKTVETSLLPLAAKLTPELLAKTVAFLNGTVWGGVFTPVEEQAVAASLPALGVLIKHSEGLVEAVIKEGI